MQALTTPHETKYSVNRKLLILFGTGISGITVGLDLTIINSSLSSIQSSINADINQLQWIMSGFGLLFCSFLVTMGRLGDIYGRKKLLMLSLVGFALASICAGLSKTVGNLILMRMLQGICGAAILPCGTALIANTFPKEEQGRALGIYGSLVGIGIGLGPFIGGILNGIYGWPAVFFINVPIILLSLLICAPCLIESRTLQRIEVDWIGSLLLALGLGAMTFSLSSVEHTGWLNVSVLLGLILSLVSFIFFFRCENKAKSPIFPPYLLNNEGFRLGTLIYAGSVSFHWPVLFLMPIYLQKILQYQPYLAGAVLASMTLMTIISPMVAGYFFDKDKKKFICHSIFFINSISLLMFIFLDSNGPLSLILTSFILYGLAWGVGNGVATPIALSTLTTTNDAGVISGALTTALNIFAVLSLAISVSLFNIFEKSALLKQVDFKSAFVYGMQFCYLFILIATLCSWYYANRLIKKIYS